MSMEWDIWMARHAERRESVCLCCLLTKPELYDIL